MKYAYLISLRGGKHDAKVVVVEMGNQVYEFWMEIPYNVRKNLKP